jgi:hypothetical protein
MLAVLAAAGLVSIAAPTADARLPRATTYHVQGRITLDTNLLSVSGVSAWAIDEYLEATTPLPPLGAAFMSAERTYGINARFLLAAALHESAWGTGYISRVKHNLFGYNAYDRNPTRYASAFATYAASIDATAKFIKDWYLTRGGRWWGGQPTLRSMQQFWSSSHTWGINVSRIATSIHLASLAGRSITFAAPVVTGPLYGAHQIEAHLTWAGGAIPPRVEFVATWELIELDPDFRAATISEPATGSSGAIDVATSPTGTASRVRTEPGSITVAVVVPAEPGSYRLVVEMRDSGGSLLPAAERLAIPTVDVRVWDDRVVRYGIEPVSS